MGKLVLLNDENKIVEVFEQNITAKQYNEIIDDYCRLLRLEKNFEKVTKENEQKLNLLLRHLTKKGILKEKDFSVYPIVKPIFDKMIVEHERKKILSNKLKKYLSDQSSLKWQQVKILFWRMFSGLPKLIHKLTKK